MSPKSAIKTVAGVAIACLLAGTFALGGFALAQATSTPASTPPRNSAASSPSRAAVAMAMAVATFPQVTVSRGGDDYDSSLQLAVKWDLFIDPTSGRFVLLGGAGCPAEPCAGVPGVLADGGGAWFELVQPRLPFSRFCIDTLKLGAKQPLNARASFLVLASTPGHGQPSISVRSDDGGVRIDKLCYPHGADGWPHLWLGNNWEVPQVMTFAVAGTVEP
jgi:hypothetical protein